MKIRPQKIKITPNANKLKSKPKPTPTAEPKSQDKAKDKMTPAQTQIYCDLVARYLKRTGFNPDASKRAEMGKKARRLVPSPSEGKKGRLA